MNLMATGETKNHYILYIHTERRKIYLEKRKKKVR